VKDPAVIPLSLFSVFSQLTLWARTPSTVSSDPLSKKESVPLCLILWWKAMIRTLDRAVCTATWGILTLEQGIDFVPKMEVYPNSAVVCEAHGTERWSNSLCQESFFAFFLVRHHFHSFYCALKRTDIGAPKGQNTHGTSSTQIMRPSISGSLLISILDEAHSRETILRL